MLTWTRAVVFLIGISLAGIITMSCGGNEYASSPTGPSSVAVVGGIGAAPEDVAVETSAPITTRDEEPSPTPGPPPEGEPPAPSPEPPAPGPAPAPTPPPPP